MARPANPEVRARLIAAGRDLFYRHGFNGCGVQDITAAAGVPKGSFYGYFDTKEAFVVDVVEDFWSEIERTHGPLLYDAPVKPLDRIAAYFKALTAEHERFDFRFGCLIGNLSMELSQSSEKIRLTLATIVARWQAAIAQCLREAQMRSELDPASLPEEIAALLIEAWEGAALRGKVERGPSPYLRFEKYVLRRLTV
jgi:TetR/AcrR family transcriptional repressor of nem operon